MMTGKKWRKATLKYLESNSAGCNLFTLYFLLYLNDYLTTKKYDKGNTLEKIENN